MTLFVVPTPCVPEVPVTVITMRAANEIKRLTRHLKCGGSSGCSLVREIQIRRSSKHSTY